MRAENNMMEVAANVGMHLEDTYRFSSEHILPMMFSVEMCDKTAHFRDFIEERITPFLQVT